MRKENNYWTLDNLKVFMQDAKKNLTDTSTKCQTKCNRQCSMTNNPLQSVAENQKYFTVSVVSYNVSHFSVGLEFDILK